MQRLPSQASWSRRHSKHRCRFATTLYTLTPWGRGPRVAMLLESRSWEVGQAGGSKHHQTPDLRKPDAPFQPIRKDLFLNSKSAHVIDFESFMIVTSAVALSMLARLQENALNYVQNWDMVGQLDLGADCTVATACKIGRSSFRNRMITSLTCRTNVETNW